MTAPEWIRLGTAFPEPSSLRKAIDTLQAQGLTVFIPALIPRFEEFSWVGVPSTAPIELTGRAIPIGTEEFARFSNCYWPLWEDYLHDLATLGSVELQVVSIMPRCALDGRAPSTAAEEDDQIALTLTEPRPLHAGDCYILASELPALKAPSPPTRSTPPPSAGPNAYRLLHMLIECDRPLSGASDHEKATKLLRRLRERGVKVTLSRDKVREHLSPSLLDAAPNPSHQSGLYALIYGVALLHPSGGGLGSPSNEPDTASLRHAAALLHTALKRHFHATPGEMPTEDLIYECLEACKGRVSRT